MSQARAAARCPRRAGLVGIRSAEASSRAAGQIPGREDGSARSGSASTVGPIDHLRVQNPNAAAVIPLPERNPDRRGSISAAQIGTTNGTTAAGRKAKALRMQGFPVAGAGFEPAAFGL